MKDNISHGGLAFPFFIASDGKISINDYNEQVRQSILLLLHTPKGERVMRPDFGVSINDYMFSNMNMATEILIKKDLRDAFNMYEPRIDIINIGIEADCKKQGVILISLKYSIKNTGSVDEILYPFSIEGE